MSSLILLKGRLFKRLSTSQNKVVNNYSVMVLPFVIDSSERLIGFMSDFQIPPIHGQRGGLSRHLTSFIVRKFSTSVWSKMLNLYLRSVAVPTKFVPLSDFIIFTWPLLEMKGRSERINESVNKSPASSR